MMNLISKPRQVDSVKPCPSQAKLRLDQVIVYCPWTRLSVEIRWHNHSMSGAITAWHLPKLAGDHVCCGRAVITST